ncbi:unnamed protein product [Cuscuta epithymum]|uniref:Uncharacterized protein n=1 Tax=Cuscuta epithymum TaxID=186058 RepID=A0AAV0CQG5_9ASTE|nr:unnamed protein product [Cuscuta epithymum]
MDKEKFNSLAGNKLPTLIIAAIPFPHSDDRATMYPTGLFDAAECIHVQPHVILQSDRFILFLPRRSPQHGSIKKRTTVIPHKLHPLTGAKGVLECSTAAFVDQEKAGKTVFIFDMDAKAVISDPTLAGVRRVNGGENNSALVISEGVAGVNLAVHAIYFGLWLNINRAMTVRLVMVIVVVVVMIMMLGMVHSLRLVVVHYRYRFHFKNPT